MKKYKDLTGKDFGKLHVIGLDYKKGNKYYWLCECGCKNKTLKSIRADRLLSGSIKSCGCDTVHNSTRENFINKEFGNLRVIDEIERVYKDGEKRYFYNCLCKCGNTKIVSRQRLKQQKVLMCDKCRNTNQYDLNSFPYGIGFASNGGLFCFDKEDYEKIRNYRWYTTTAGYIRAHIDECHSIFMHSLIYGNKEKIDIDHVNTIKCDNRKKNLREATRGENVINRKPIRTNISGVTGVHWNSNAKKWQASIMKDGVSHYLGIYDDYYDAVKARKMAEIYYFGEYSYNYFNKDYEDQ